MNPKDKDFEDACHIEGRYANNFKIGHNAFEFVLDFAQFYPGEKEVHPHTRVITSPAYAKALLKTLRESFARYEETYGAVPKEEEGG